MTKWTLATQDPLAGYTHINLLSQTGVNQDASSFSLSYFLPSPAIGHWDAVEAKPHIRVMPRDFVTMGRMAVDEGCTTAREFALYYKFKDIRCKDEGILRYGCKIPPGMTFGRPAR